MKICKSILSKARGLMFSRKRKLFFIFKKEQRLNIHTFFVFFPIDIFFLDKNRKIIEEKRNMKPFRIYRTKNKVKYMLEIPSRI